MLICQLRNPYCSAERLGDYCHACGQYHLDDRLTLRVLWREFVERFLKLERGVFRTLWYLTRRPGAVALAYVDGRRRPYVNPLSYLLLASAFSVLLLPFNSERIFEQQLDPDNPEVRQQMEFGARVAGGSLEGLTPEQEARFREATAAVLAELPRAFSDLYSVLYVALALLLAAALRLFMGGSGRAFTFAETAVLTMYVSAQLAVISSVVALALAGSRPVFLLLTTVALTIGLTVWGALGFYGRTARVAVLSLVSVLAAFMVYNVVVVVTAYPLAIYRAVETLR